MDALKRPLRRHLLLLLPIVLLGAAIVLPSGCASSFPQPHVFTDPPYTQIVEGIVPLLDRRQERLPDLAAGSKVAFYARADGAIDRILCDAPLAVPVRVPAVSAEVGIAAAAGGDRSANGDSAVPATYGGRTDVRFADRQRAVAADESAGRMGSVDRQGSVEVGRDAGGLASLGATGALAQAAEGSGGIRTGAARGAVLASGDGGRLAAVDGRGDVAGGSSAGGESSARTDGEALAGVRGEGGLSEEQARREAAVRAEAGAHDPAKASEVGGHREDEGRHDTARGLTAWNLIPGAGGIWFLSDADARIWELDQDFIESFVESVRIGYADSDDVTILDAMCILIPLEERDRVRGLLHQGGLLSAILDCDITMSWRDRFRPDGPPGYAGAISLQSHPEFAVYGHCLGLIVTVTNTGQAPLFDGLILNALPEHTQFLAFAHGEEDERGFAAFYLPDRRFVAVRLYRPLFPGESFRFGFVVRADPWRLDAPEDED